VVSIDNVVVEYCSDGWNVIVGERRPNNGIIDRLCKSCIRGSKHCDGIRRCLPSNIGQEVRIVFVQCRVEAGEILIGVKNTTQWKA